jgi:hypothetical protein
VCVATHPDGEFNPEFCPMLAGLDARERARRMELPWVKQCIEQRRREARPAAASEAGSASAEFRACARGGAEFGSMGAVA